MIFQAHRSENFLGWLIRLFSVGIYNHISIRINEYVYEAHIKKGVTKTLYTNWDSSDVVAIKEMPLSPTQEARVLLWLGEQVGKKYDLIGIISFLFAVLPPRKGYWYCSELAIVVFSKAVDRTDEIETQKISPTLFWNFINLVL